MQSLARRPALLVAVFVVYAVALAGGVAMLVNGVPDAVATTLQSGGIGVTASTTGRPVTFTVEAGETGIDIASALADAGVIDDRDRFEVLLNLTGGGSDLKAGCYVFSERSPAAEVVLRLKAGLTSLKSVGIPEGRRVEEVGASFVAAGITTQAAWDAALASASRDALPEAPPGDSLNGYLFPATYPVECNVDAPKMVEAMLDAFAAQVTPELVAEAKAKGLSLHDVVTMASIVEREAVKRDEQPVIASVFLNRLDEDMPLQADPTVQYAVASADPPKAGGTWWKTDLTEDDLEIDSPYNTYQNRGLPPGPIANPGIDAILAVIRPAQTDYLYFAAKGDGSHAFAATLAEHNANVDKYLR